MVRASLAVDAELAKELSKIAKERHMTLYALTNQIVEAAISLMKEDMELTQLKNLWKIFKVLKDVDAVVLPSAFMDLLLAEMYKHDSKQLLSIFHQLGSEIGQYLKVEIGDIDNLLELAKGFSKFFPLKKLEYSYLGDGEYEISIIGVGGRMESTLCVYQALKAIIEKYEARIDEENITRGLIRIKINLKK